MGQTITVRLTKELAEWLAHVATRTGQSQGQIVREQLEKARSGASGRAFMRWAGTVRGARDLSARKGFSRP
jgi:predicted transcriptional regulator